jgi:hypothetical protein
MSLRQIKNTTISTKFSEIENLLDDAKIWAAADPRLAAHLATYIDVYLLGVIEESIEILVKQRASKSNDSEVCNYINNDINKSFRNPRRNTILEVLRKFSDTYASSFQSSFSDTCPEIEALQSVLDHKTNLAHKGTAQLGLTLQDTETYFNRILPIILKLEQILTR